ncbi:MAG: DUF6395 domain-containing protein [Cellulosilyticaceae bacterium]
MRVEYYYQNSILEFKFYPHDEDSMQKIIKIGNHNCEFQLPEDLNLGEVHPDVMALVVLLMLYPFTNKKIELPFSISRYFADTVKRIAKKDMGPVNEALEPNVVLGNTKVALAYSGGVDSTAALLLLPEDTIIYFIDRKVPEGVETLYRKDAPLNACNAIRANGRKVYNITTDFEYVRNPVGFPVEVACAIPGLLLSKYESIDSIAMGMVMESAYRTGHEIYEDYAKRWHYKVWGGLFKAVGIPLNLVVAGISEVGTQTIVRQSPYADIAESCMMAEGGKPCMKCMKCFRKKMLEKTLDREPLNKEFLEQFFKTRRMKKFLISPFIKHQNVYMYITSHYEGDYEPMLLVKKKVGGDLKNVDWIEKWYGPSIELVPQKYQKIIEENITKQLQKMTPEECAEVMAWNLYPFLESEEYAKVSQQLEEILKTL